MKSYTIANTVFLLLCTLSLGFFTSCSDDDSEGNTGRSGTEIVNLINKYLYASDGSVNAAQLDTYQEGEYALTAENAEDVCLFFSQLTGTDSPLKSNYEYEYKFIDEKGNTCKISIRGKKEATNGLYATIYFSIPECSEIKIIHIGTSSLLEGTNSEDKGDGYKIPIMGIANQHKKSE